MNGLDPIKAKVAEVAMRKMLKADRHFDICAVRNVLEILDIPGDKQIMSLLKPLHCVDWADMDSELREQVVVLLAQLFQGEAMPTFAGVIANDQRNQKRIARH